MTLQEAKELIAKEFGYSSWEMLRFSHSTTFDKERNYANRAAELYAQSAKAEAWDKLLEEVKDILDITLEEQEKLSNLSNPYKIGPCLKN